jgi:rubrerythrin
MRSPDHAERNDHSINGENLVRNETDFSNLAAEEEELEDVDVEDDDDLNLLVAMAELDAEAAEAYRIAAEYADDPLLRAKLEEFRADHLRHVETFNRLLTNAGVAEVPADLDEDSSAVTMLAASMGSMGVRAALMAMIANEQLTTAMYEAAMELPFEDEVARILEVHMADEQRHLDWLSEQETRAGNEELDAEAGG